MDKFFEAQIPPQNQVYVLLWRILRLQNASNNDLSILSEQTRIFFIKFNPGVLWEVIDA